MQDYGFNVASTDAGNGRTIRQQLTLGSGEAAFSFTRARVPEGAAVSKLAESGGELLIVIAGSATVSLGDSARAVAGGDVLSISSRTEYETVANGGPLEVAVVAWPSVGTKPAGHAITGPAARAFDRASMEWAYEMYLGDLYSAQQIPGLPFGSSFGSVAPRSTSKYHFHQDSELLLILGGEAMISLGNETRLVPAGDFAVIPPFLVHGVRNDAGTPVDLISIYWENPGQAKARLDRIDVRDEVPDRTIVFCPPPTPNGGLHIGHIAGPYVRADMFARGLRTVGKVADLVVGTDDHQSYVAAAAAARGAEPGELARAEGDRLAATLGAIGFDAVRVYRPGRDPGHQERIRRMFDAVCRSPAATRADVETPWCETCDVSLYQAFAVGSCPACAAASDGEICEECGHPNAARDLGGLVCQRCGGQPRTRPESALLLNLQDLADPIKRYLRRVQGSASLRLLAEQLLAEGLDHYRISRSSRWGIALPVSAEDEVAGPRTEEVTDPRAEEVIDPWVELALTQLDNMRQLKMDDGRAVSFLGFDNSFYYSILLPALAVAAGQPEFLPYGYVVNFFLHLDGEKISTSKNHAIWVDDLLGMASADVVRLALARHAPEEEPGNISTAEVADIHNDPLLAKMRRWLGGLPAGPVPGTGAWTVVHREFYRSLSSYSRNLDALLSPETFTSRGYLCLLDSFVTSALGFRATEIGKRLLPGMAEEARTSVALEYLATKSLAAFVYPIMPGLGGQLWEALSLPGVPFREREWVFPQAGTTMRSVSLDARRRSGARAQDIRTLAASSPT